MKKLSLLFTCILVVFTTSAQIDVWDGSADIWTKGEGTQDNPYLIESAEHLAFIAEMVNAGVTTYEGVYFKLMTDLDLNNIQWSPIGSSDTKFFSGFFDGNNNQIYNMVSTLGLFGYTKTATIKNIAISGEINETNNKNKDIYRGGIVGTELDTGQIVNCVNMCNVTGYKVGGIVGKFQGEIRNCTNYGVIRCPSGGYENGNDYWCYAGGIVCSGSDGVITNCKNEGTVSCGTENSSAKGISPSSEFKIWNCYSYSGGLTSSLYYNCIHMGGQISINRGSNSYSVGKTNGYITKTHELDKKTEAQMKSVSFPIILNTDSTVFIMDVTPNVNQGYPIFKNQVSMKAMEATGVASTIATMQGAFYSPNEPTSIGFEYRRNDESIFTRVSGVVDGNALSCQLTDLQEGEKYVYRMFLIQNGVKSYSDTTSFTTFSCQTDVNKINVSFCDGEEYDWDGTKITMAGTYEKTIVGTNGCDSIVELTVSVNPTYTISTSATICQGESYDFYGTNIAETGIYTKYVPIVDGCNLVTLNLSVAESYSRELNENILQGESYEFFGENLTTSGKYTKVLKTQDDCDSVINLTLTVGTAYMISAVGNVDTLGSVTGGGKYGAGESIILTATPESYATFVSWHDGNTENPRTILVEENVMYIAQFSLLTYAVNVSYDENRGEVSGGGEYQYGTVTVLTATPNEGYDFQKWSDGVTDNPRSYSVTNDLSVSAIFTPKEYTVQISSENETIGSVWGGGTISFNESTTIYASPISGYRFVMWSDGNKDNPRTITVTGNVSLVALFELVPEVIEMYEVAINTEDATKGTVSGVTSGEFSEGATIAFYATANDGYEFVSWSDGITDNPRVVSITQDISLLAVFRVIPDPTDIFNIQIVSADEIKGTVSGITSGTIKEGSTVVFYATANEGYEFEGWSDGNTENPRSVTITQDISLSAVFRVIPEPTDIFNVQITSADENKGTVSGITSGTIKEGTVVVFYATANDGYEFDGWSDGNIDNPRSVTINGDIELVATFNQLKYYSITAISVDNKLGAVVGNGIFRENSVISIVAVPEKGCQFVKWNDGNTNNPREINVTEDIILIATFESNPKTDIPSNLENKTIITIANKQILVNGEAPAFVVSVSGQKIANANLKAGVYFVVVEGNSVKVVIR